MKRFLIAALATFCIPMTAQAGFGVTHYSSIEITNGANSAGVPYFSPAHTFPSLDYKSGPLVVQVDAVHLRAPAQLQSQSTLITAISSNVVLQLLQLLLQMPDYHHQVDVHKF